MARIRTVKPEFFRHEGLSGLSIEAHFLAASLLCYADDDGYFNANPKLIAAECFPLRDEYGSPTVVIIPMLKELESQGYLKLGTGIDGRRYGQIKNFGEHQVINKKRYSTINDLIIDWDEYGSTTVVVQEYYRPEKKKEKEKEKEKEGNSSPIGSQPTREKNIPEIELLKNYGVEGQIAKDFLKIRKAKRAPVTETALKGIYDEANKAGIDFNHAIRICIERNWQRFKADWDWKPKQPDNKKPSRMSLEGIDYQEGVNADGSI